MTKLYEKNHNDEPLLREIHSDESSDPVASITQEELRIRLSEEQSRIKQLLENVTSRDSDEINENKTLFDGVDDEDREDNEASGEASKSLVHVSLYGRTNHKVHSYSVINEQQQQHVSWDNVSVLCYTSDNDMETPRFYIKVINALLSLNVVVLPWREYSIQPLVRIYSLLR